MIPCRYSNMVSLMPIRQHQLRNVWIHKAWGSLVEMWKCATMCPDIARLWYVGVNKRSSRCLLVSVIFCDFPEFVVDDFMISWDFIGLQESFSFPPWIWRSDVCCCKVSVAHAGVSGCRCLEEIPMLRSCWDRFRARSMFSQSRFSTKKCRNINMFKTSRCHS